MTDKLYVVQLDDDPYCAPWVGAICKTLEQAIQYAKKQDRLDVRCIEEWSFNKAGIAVHTKTKTVMTCEDLRDDE